MAIVGKLFQFHSIMEKDNKNQMLAKIFLN